MRNVNSISRCFCLIMMCVFLLILSACGGSSDTSQTNENGQQTEIGMKDSEIQVDADGKGASARVDIDDASGNLSVNMEEGVDVPKDYPSDIAPLYPDGTVTVYSEQEKIISVGILTKDSMEDIYKFYDEKIKLDTVDQKQQTEAMSMISGVAGSFHVDVTICMDSFSGENGFLISIVITPIS